MENEIKPRTAEEAIVAEYYEVKKENKHLKAELEGLESLYNKLLEEIRDYRKAFKALNIIIDDYSTIEVSRDLVRSDDEGYNELKSIIEQLADDEKYGGMKF